MISFSIVSDDPFDLALEITKSLSIPLSTDPARFGYEYGYFVKNTEKYLAIHQYGKELFTTPLIASKRHVIYFIQLIENHYFKEHSPKYYAASLNLGETTLRKICQKELNHPPLYWINFRKILAAQYLLCKTSHPIKVISFEVGINDVSYFSRLFKNYLGMSPSTFRKITLSD